MVGPPKGRVTNAICLGWVKTKAKHRLRLYWRVAGCSVVPASQRFCVILHCEWKVIDDRGLIFVGFQGERLQTEQPDPE